MRSMKLGAVAVATLCAVAGFGRPAFAGTNDGDTPNQNQNQSQNQNQYQSQNQHGHHAGWQKQFAQFSKVLNLTEDQREKVRPFFEDQAEQLRAVAGDHSTPKEDRQEKIRAIHQATEDKIEACLTPDQMEKWGQWKQKNWDRAAERRERQNDQDQWHSHRRGNQEGNWQARFERFTKAVSLTDEQQEKIRPLFQNEAQQFESLRHDRSLSKQARQERMSQIRESTQDQIQSFLTPDQLQKWGAFQQESRDQSQDRREWRMHRSGGQQNTWQARFEQFSKTLNLTEDQQEKIRPFFQEQAEQISAVNNDKSLSQEDRRDRVQAIHFTTEEKIEPFLSPDQMEKWGEWKQHGWDQAEERNEQTASPSQDQKPGTDTD